jgi:hypothetical protein
MEHEKISASAVTLRDVEEGDLLIFFEQQLNSAATTWLLSPSKTQRIG